MENTISPESMPDAQEAKTDRISLSFKKPRPLMVVIFVSVVLVIAGAYFGKGLVVAATVNGSPISRIEVIRELENQGGKQALEALIDKKLIEAELDKNGISVPSEEIDAEMKKIEEEVSGQGGTFAAALSAQGMTEEKLREQVILQKKIERLLADKIAVTDSDIDAYIKDSEMTPPEGAEAEDFRKRIGEQLKQQKFQQEAQTWMSDLTTNAKIDYYVTYQ